MKAASLRATLLGVALLGLSGCSGNNGELWLSMSREPQPPTMQGLRTAVMVAEGISPDSDGTALNAALARLSGRQSLAVLRAELDASCAHFLNRMRAAQAASRMTSIGISTTNALTLGIMGATSAAAPAIAIVGASIAAMNSLNSGFDETVLMTQYADRIADLVAAEQMRLRSEWENDAQLNETGLPGHARAVGRGVEYARSCNYSGLRRLLDRAVNTGTLEAQLRATTLEAEAQGLHAALAGIGTVLNRTVSLENAAMLRLGMDNPSRLEALPAPLREAAAPLLANRGDRADRARLIAYLNQAERSAAFRSAVAALR